MRGSAAGVGLLVAIVCSATSGAAETRLGLLLGFRSGGEVETVGLDPTLQLDLEGEPAFGAVFERRIHPDGWIAVLWSHQETEFDPGGVYTGGRPVDLDIDYLHAGGVYRPAREGPLRPFVMLTAGLTSFRTGDPDLGDDLGLSIAVGGGAYLRVGERTTLRFEARGYATFEDAVFSGFCGPSACTLELAGGGAFQLETLAGVAFDF